MLCLFGRHFCESASACGGLGFSYEDVNKTTVRGEREGGHGFFSPLSFFQVLCAALTLAARNDPVVEVKKYADASLTSKSIFVPPNSLRQAPAETRQVREPRCWLLFKAAAQALGNAS